MTTWFITRHPGAVRWAGRKGLQVDRFVQHLELAAILPGDTVIGILPIHLAAAVCARGACFYNLSLDLPADERGRELSADQLETYGARLEPYVVMPEQSATGVPE